MSDNILKFEDNYDENLDNEFEFGEYNGYYTYKCGNSIFDKDKFRFIKKNGEVDYDELKYLELLSPNTEDTDGNEIDRDLVDDFKSELLDIMEKYDKLKNTKNKKQKK